MTVYFPKTLDVVRAIPSVHIFSSMMLHLPYRAEIQEALLVLHDYYIFASKTHLAQSHPNTSLFGP